MNGYKSSFADNFNVPLSMVNHTHFQRFAVQGPKHKRSYMQLVKDPSGDLYSFIAIDASLEPGKPNYIVIESRFFSIN